MVEVVKVFNCSIVQLFKCSIVTDSYRPTVLQSYSPIVLNHLDLLIQFFYKCPELLVGFHQVIHGTAGMKNGCMVFIPAMKADVGERSFCVLF